MDISVGDRATRSLTLTNKHMTEFANLSGDRNPLHFDEDFAARHTLWPEGGLTTGLLPARWPGPGTVFMSQEWEFTAPVFVDDTITAEAEVLRRT
jgi:acyl dehydratase